MGRGKAGGSCNALTSMADSSPRQKQLSAQSLSSGCLPSLGGGGLGPRRNSAQSVGSPVALRAGSAGGPFANSGNAPGKGGGPGGSAAFAGGSLQKGREAAGSRGPAPPRALPFDAVPAPPPQQQLPLEQLAEEAGEWMLEGASHGIASVDCFELFGFPEDAPNLRDANSPDAKAQDRQRRTAEAACLLTPATGLERDMGAQLHAAVRRAAVETDAQTQANYAEEIRRQAAATLLEELDATLSSPEKASPRRRRRAEDERLDAEVLRIIVDDAGGAEAEPSAGGERHSPRTREALAALFADRQPARNMLTIDEEDLPLMSADVAASIDLPPGQAPEQVIGSPGPTAEADATMHPAVRALLVSASDSSSVGHDSVSMEGAAAFSAQAAGPSGGSGVSSPSVQHPAYAEPEARPGIGSRSDDGMSQGATDDSGTAWNGPCGPVSNAVPFRRARGTAGAPPGAAAEDA